MKTVILFLTGFFIVIGINAQKLLTLDEMIDHALKRNESIHASELDIAYQRQLKRTASDIGPANVIYMRGQINSFVKNDYNLNVAQNIPFPLVFAAKRSLSDQQVRGSEIQKLVVENELVYQVKQAFFNLMFLKEKEDLLKKEDSIYRDFISVAQQRLAAGNTALLVVVTAESEHYEVQNRLASAQGQIIANRTLLQTLLNSDEEIRAKGEMFLERNLELEASNVNLINNPDLSFLKQRIQIAEADRKVASANLWPGINVGVFTQILVGSPTSDAGGYSTKSNHYNGFQVGLNIPIWAGPQIAKVKAAKIAMEYNESKYKYSHDKLQGEWEHAVQTYLLSKNNLAYYQTTALANADRVLSESRSSYKSGQIDYPEYWLSIQHVMKIKENFLSSLNDVNQSVIYLEYLTGSN